MSIVRGRYMIPKVSVWWVKKKRFAQLNGFAWDARGSTVYRVIYRREY